MKQVNNTRPVIDRAGQGTGRWTAIEAQHLGAPIQHKLLSQLAIYLQIWKQEKMENLFLGWSKTLPEGFLDLHNLEAPLLGKDIMLRLLPFIFSKSGL